jgi:hypothetical protein
MKSREKASWTCPSRSLEMKLTGDFLRHISDATYICNDIKWPKANVISYFKIRHFRQIMTEGVRRVERGAVKAMVRNPQIAVLQEMPREQFLSEALWRSRVVDDVKLDLTFLFEFNRDLDRNAQLSRLNEKYLEQRMEELDEHVPICREVYEHTRSRLHELLLLCAANYANNCEYGPVGELMFNPRLTLVHVRGRHEPVVKERHMPLSEQFMDMAGTRTEVVLWLKEETTLEIKKKPLIPHSYEILERCRFVSREYLDSTQDRAVQIADLSAFLSCRGFEERLELDAWLRSASQGDRALMESRLLRLDWGRFQKLGSLVDLMVYQLFRDHATLSSSAPPVDKSV